MSDADGSATVARTAGRGLTRRDGLLAVALLTPVGLIAACTGPSEPPPGSATPSAARADLAADVAAEEMALIVSYDSVLAAVTGLSDEATALLTLIRDQHGQHLEALGGSAAPSPSASTSSPSTPEAARTSLMAAEREAARSRIRACVVADDADLARLLTFIGASEASHVPALRDLSPAGA